MKYCGLLILIISLALTLGCGAQTLEETGPNVGKYVTAENDRGGNTPIRIVFPKGGKNVPLVLMAHGFTGTMNSGGAAELAQRLADAGIASVRVDFNSEKEPGGERVNQYTLSSMVSDLLLAEKYVAEHYSIDEVRIGLYGRSMGGRVCMIMANENEGNLSAKAMALVAPAGTDNAMIDFMGGRKKWEEMKTAAKNDSFVECKGLQLSPKWFSEFEEYDPSQNGNAFESPVLVIYNTKDDVVTSETSIRCGEAYSQVEMLEVSTEDGHGYEMSYKTSALKSKIMDEIVSFFAQSL